MSHAVQIYFVGKYRTQDERLFCGEEKMKSSTHSSLPVLTRTVPPMPSVEPGTVAKLVLTSPSWYWPGRQAYSHWATATKQNMALRKTRKNRQRNHWIHNRPTENKLGTSNYMSRTVQILYTFILYSLLFILFYISNFFCILTRKVV